MMFICSLVVRDEDRGWHTGNDLASDVHFAPPRTNRSGKHG